MIWNAQGEEGTAGNGDGCDDVHPVVKDNLLLLVDAVTQLIYFVGSTYLSIQVIENERLPPAFGCRTGFCTVDFGSHGIPRTDKGFKKAIVVATDPGIYINNMFHIFNKFNSGDKINTYNQI